MRKRFEVGDYVRMTSGARRECDEDTQWAFRVTRVVTRYQSIEAFGREGYREDASEYFDPRRGSAQYELLLEDTSYFYSLYDHELVPVKQPWNLILNGAHALKRFATRDALLHYARTHNYQIYVSHTAERTWYT